MSSATPAGPLSTKYAPRERVSLHAVLRPLARGPLDPTMCIDGSGVWRTARTPQGAATMHFEAGSDGIDVLAWGAGAHWAIASVPELLGHGDDWSGLDVSANPVLVEARRRNPGLRLTRTGLVLEMLLAAILEQKVTGVEARRSWRTLLTKFGDPAPGPAPAPMRVFPEPDTWRRIPSWEWHRAGVGPDRAATALRAAGVAASLERTLLLGRGGPDVERALRSIPGVGVWTAAETMQRAHGDPDSPSVGDYHLSSRVGWALIGEAIDDDGMLELLAPWAGHRERVVRLIESIGAAPPRRGPRITIQDHRGH